MNGVEKSHPILRHYFNDAKGIIFVVDSTTDEDLEKVKEEIHHILGIGELENCPVLIFANKNDSNGALTLDQIKKKIDMGTVPQKKQNIVESNANTGDGIDSGMKWLLSSAKD